MFRSQQHREKAAAYGELIKHSSGQGQNDELQKLRDRHSALADYEQGLADDNARAVNATEQHRAHGLALAPEEEHVLRCLGAAIIMQWNALPRSMQREIFDTAASVGELLETAALRGQIARFLHKHKDGAGRKSLRRRMRIATRNRAQRLCRDGTMREAQSQTDCRSETTSATGGFPCH
jgi:hypothetical protein